MDGKLLEGSDVKLSCKSSDGSEPINYKWERVLDKGKSLGKLPNLALIGKEDNWHYADMLTHHSSPLQRNATKIHFHISDFYGLHFSEEVLSTLILLHLLSASCIPTFVDSDHSNDALQVSDTPDESTVTVL